MKITAGEAAELLMKGKVVAVPTETVYGLAAIATNPAAIAKIFEVKNRPADNPLICHFYSMEQVEEYVVAIPVAAKKLIPKFSPGPVSFMLDLPENSPLKFATCGRAQVIARIPDHELFLSIIKTVQQPVAAPSANTSGRVSPTSAEMVEDDLGRKIDGIVEGGFSSVGLESTIIDARSEEEIYILRPGAIGEDEIKSVLPDAKIIMVDSNREDIIPGSRYRHYAPDTPLLLIERIDELENESDAVLIVTTEDAQQIPRRVLKKFSDKNIHLLLVGSISDLNALGKNFYQTLSAIDHMNVLKAYFLKTDFGNSSLGKALQNRLQRIVAY